MCGGRGCPVRAPAPGHLGCSSHSTGGPPAAPFPRWEDEGVSDRVPYLASRLQGFATTIFAEMSALATETGSINLGQGFPDTDGPPEVADAAVAAIRAGHNQYPPGPGIPELRQAVASHQQRFYRLGYDP